MRNLFCLLLLCATSPALADELDVRSNPERDEFFVTVSTAMVELRPGDDDFVRVSYDCAPEESRSAADGLRVVSESERAPSLRRSNGKIELRFADAAGDCRIAITAPPILATRLRIEAAGRIDVRDWQSSLTAWSAAGDVDVLNQQGPFSITGMAGDVTVEYTSATLESESAVTAASGTLRLALPGNPSVDIRAIARWGDVLTDLDAEFTEEVSTNGTWSVTETGNGGPSVTLRNLNENIEILKTLE